MQQLQQGAQQQARPQRASSAQHHHLQRYLDDSSTSMGPAASASEGEPSRAASMLKVLQPVPPGATMTLSFHNVCGWVPASLQPPSVGMRLKKALAKGGDGCLPLKREPSHSGAAHEGMRQVMFDLSGVVKPGGGQG